VGKPPRGRRSPLLHANEIVGLAPAELFVHRNVANIVVAGDANCMATVQ